MKELSKAVDPKLCDQQAEFRSNRSCADQIVSLRKIIEQSLEWEHPGQEEKGKSKKHLDAGCIGKASVTRYDLEQCRQSSLESRA